MSARVIPLLLLLTSACATTGSTFRSGVGDAFPEKPPYYAGRRSAPATAPAARIGILPVYYQPGAAQPDLFDPRWGPGTPLGSLLGEMNAYLDSIVTASGARPIRLVDGTRVSAVAPLSLGVPPDVQFGCLTEGNLPAEDCAARGDSALGRRPQQMKLAVGRPSAAWMQWASEAMVAHDVSAVLVVTLELGNYLTRQRGITGRKSVELGTGYEVPLPWLTSLETPVSVIQVTGALVGRDGRAIRIGAEGVYARRSRLLVSAMGAQEIIGDGDLQELRSRRRDDLPDRPLVWQAALRELATRLTR